jgi:isopentenyl-diphosphate Delta-isomerase
MSRLIAVDKNDNRLGLVDKTKAHQKKGVLHRAFSVLVFSSQNKMLIQRRAKQKKLWPLFWSNTCCSHAKPGQDIKAVAKQRLKEELGFTAGLEFVYKFCYLSEFKNIGSENELCHVFIGQHDGLVKPDKNEVAEFKWVDINWLLQELDNNGLIFTPWFKKEITELKKRGRI